MRKYYIIIMLLLSVMSCKKKDEFLSDTRNDGEPMLLSISASLPDLTQDDVKGAAANYAGPKWEENDELSIINLTTGKILKDRLTAVSSGQKANFTGSVSGGITVGDKLAFLYPAQDNEETVEFTSADVDFSSQTMTKSTQLCAYGTMTADEATIGDVANHEIAFTMFMTFYQFSLTSLPASMEIDRIVLENVSNGITVTIKDGDLISTSNSSNNAITVNSPLSPKASTKTNGSYTLRMSVVKTDEVSSREMAVYSGENEYRSAISTASMDSHKYYNEVVTGFDKIKFADQLVRQYCLESFDYDNDGNISFAEAAAVPEIPTSGTPSGIATKAPSSGLPIDIVSFDELKNFTGLTSYPCFAGYSSLTSVCVPEQITSMPDNCFNGCAALEQVVMYPETPPTLGSDAFTGTDAVIYVPRNSVSEYQSNDDWKDLNIEDKTVLEDAVDLGLSVKWASCNVGASKPEEYGGYYAWGETVQKDEYSWTTYKYCLGSKNSLTKYNIDSAYGTVDNLVELESADDAATANWGENWRMPSKDEWDELVEKCIWEWTSVAGVKGYKLTSKQAGHTDKSIFLPAAGSHLETRIDFLNERGDYWNAGLFNSGSEIRPQYGGAYEFLYDGRRYGCGFFRFVGLPVRPVYDPNGKVTAPAVNTVLHSASSYSSVVGGRIMSEGGTPITSYGVVWSENENPTVDLGTKLEYYNQYQIEDSTFAGYIRGLNAGKKYFARAFAINAKGVSYGGQVSFTCGQETKEYVDLGLSVKWATCNIGASSPENYGDYYAWGETEVKSEYSEQTYKHCNGTLSSLTKYNTNEEYGVVDNKVELELADDVANVKWGDGWRIPSESEVTELLFHCTFENITINSGDIVTKVTSNVSGYTDKYIIVPCASQVTGDGQVWHAGRDGSYWYSRISDGWDSFRACGFDFDAQQWFSQNRYFAHPIRPVYDTTAPEAGETENINYEEW